mgnify:CR=1 FL=1
MSEQIQTGNPVSVPTWEEKGDAAKIELLRGEVKLLTLQVLELAAYARSLRLMVQNHTHIDATNQVVFPAAVFDQRPAERPRKSPLD